MQTINVYEEWRKDWSTPDVYVLDELGEKVYLREHTLGFCPIVFNLPKGKKFEYLVETTQRTKEEIKLLKASNTYAETN